MKSYVSRILFCSVLGCALAGVGSAQSRRGRIGGPQAGVYTNVSGTILQFNYDRGADIEGFLLSSNTLVHLPPRAAIRVGTSLHEGERVEVAGLAQTSPSGFTTVEAQSITERSSGKTFKVPQPGGAAPFSGSGRIQQLNYGADGAVNGFLLDNGTFATVPPFAANNPSSIRVGSQIVFSGYARSTMSGRTAVDVQTLNVNGQALAMGAAGPGGGPGAPPPPPAGLRNAPAPPPSPDALPAAAGRTDEPPAPPAPPAQF